MALYYLSAIVASNTRGQHGAKSREYTTRMRHFVQLSTMTTLSATSTRQGVTEKASKRRHSVEERRLHKVRTGRSCPRMVRRNRSRSPGVGRGACQGHCKARPCHAYCSATGYKRLVAMARHGTRRRRSPSCERLNAKQIRGAELHQFGGGNGCNNLSGGVDMRPWDLPGAVCQLLPRMCAA
jgi:hypothetical protein